MSRAVDFARRLSSGGGSGLLVEVDPPDRNHTLIGVYDESADSHVIVTVPHKGPAPITVTHAALKAPVDTRDDDEAIATVLRLLRTPPPRKGWFRRGK